MIRKIVKLGDENLRKICKPMPKFDLRLWLLLRDMKETMYKAEGVGLAAPQVGILRRAVVIIDNDDKVLELINPEVIWQSEEQVGEFEGCLSVPGEYGIVKRPMNVRVRAQNRFGEWFEVEGTGLTARCFCHEIDHLEGILFTEKSERMLTEEEIGDGED